MQSRSRSSSLIPSPPLQMAGCLRGPASDILGGGIRRCGLVELFVLEVLSGARHTVRVWDEILWVDVERTFESLAKHGGRDLKAFGARLHKVRRDGAHPLSAKVASASSDISDGVFGVGSRSHAHTVDAAARSWLRRE